MKYLNILIIAVVIALSVAPFFAAPPVDFAGYSQESGMECHCEAHQQLEKNNVYIIDCDTSDKLTSKYHIQTRTIPVSQVLTSDTKSIHYIFPPYMIMADSLSVMVDTPPPKLA